MLYNNCFCLHCKLMQIDIYQIPPSVSLMVKFAQSPKDKNKQTSVVEKSFPYYL